MSRHNLWIRHDWTLWLPTNAVRTNHKFPDANNHLNHADITKVHLKANQMFLIINLCELFIFNCINSLLL